MSDEKKGALGDFVKNVKAGFGQMKTGAGKPKPEQSEPTLSGDVIEANSPNSAGPDQAVLDDDLLDEQGPEEVSPQPSKPNGGLKNLSTKKKVLLGVVVLIAVFLLKNAAENPVSAPSKPNPEQHAEKGKDKGDEVALDFGKSDLSKDESSNGALMPSPLGAPPVVDNSVGKQLEDLDLNGPFQGNETKAAPAVPKPQQESASLDAFGFPAAPAKDSVEHQVDSDLGAGKSTAALPVADLFAPATASGAPAATEAKPEANPFGKGVTENTDTTLAAPTMLGKPAHVLAGTPLQNPDSGTQPRLQDSASAEMAELGAQLKAKDAKILSLENQLQLAKLDTPSKVQSKPVKAKASAPVKHSPAIAPRTAPKANLVATSSPRPKVCVKAVAPAARNCSTCVAHAFIVDNGVENMVGQGDYIQQYRVSITGDRLDLQNSAGQVMHKFWSQPNGCAAL